MTSLRALIRDNRRFAAVLLVLALCLKAAIPAGLMLSPTPASTLTISICADSSGARQAMQMVIPGKPAEPSGQTKHLPCAFAGHGQAMLGGADAILLALAFAFILVLGLAPARRLPFSRAGHLRPPLRGPPAVA